MTERSNPRIDITESRGRWKRGMGGGDEWTLEGEPMGLCPVGETEFPPLSKSAV